MVGTRSPSTRRRLCPDFERLILQQIACGAFVYVMGGTNFSYLHAFYVPIILAGMVFRMPGGFLAGFQQEFYAILLF